MSRPSEESAGATGWVFGWSADGDWRSPGSNESGSRVGNHFVHVTGDCLPEQSGDCLVHVVFAGTLYNRAELAASLGDAARDTCGDAELIRQAFQRWGEGFLSRLCGTFAVIVVDGERERVLAARDPLGVFPLYWSRCGDTLLLSMSIPALLGCPGVSGEIHREVVAERICQRSGKADETYWRHVKRVPLGCALRHGTGEAHFFRYWDPAPLDREVRWASLEEVDRFEGMLEAAIRRPLSHGRAGIFLSGGLDSVSVAAVAADTCQATDQPRPLALSLVFPHPDCNEEAAQRSVATSLGLPQVLLPFAQAVGPQGLFQAAVELSAGWPHPLFNPWMPAYRSLAQEGRKRGCDVILTGNGGDEWLNVTPFYAADLIARFQFRRLRNLVSSHIGSFHLPPLAIARSTIWQFGIREILTSSLKRALHRYLPSVYDARWRWHFRHRLPAWFTRDPALRKTLEDRAADNYRPPPAVSAYLREGHRALEHPIISLDMEENFENGRRQGVHIAAPYWDPELVDFLYRVPPESLYQNGRTKGLVRSMLVRRFPQLQFERHRKVLASKFFDSIMQKEGPVVWDSLGGLSALSQLDLVNPRSSSLSVGGILNTAPEYSIILFELLSTESWLRVRL